MNDRRLYNTSNYDIDIFAQGTAESKFGFVTAYPGRNVWVFIEGDELLTLRANIVIDKGVNSSVIFSQELKASPGGYLYNIFNRKEIAININYDQDFFEFIIT
ncbi:hypothetical protein FE394_15880 [Xenorhabdus sp. Reich]|uniref:Uncharacterized protein n=1 Tax=Xenorhabdus littoralis TaxID=2582835 RepID=A0ABU4SPS1_9GAMM|nr:hypothetical protein [Xenorhabdus sp. Reich]MDX8000634.1 hypothetical protein [Xenorhabdus sp. Reich]